MKTEIELRKQAIALHLQGWKKSEIARKAAAIASLGTSVDRSLSSR